jgi:hypothetical protein
MRAQPAAKGKPSYGGPFFECRWRYSLWINVSLPKLGQSLQSGVAHMLISTEELEWQSELDYANRAFAAMVGGQRYENITREEATRLRQPTRQCPPSGLVTERLP